MPKTSGGGFIEVNDSANHASSEKERERERERRERERERGRERQTDREKEIHSVRYRETN